MDELRPWALWAAVAVTALALAACLGAGLLVTPPSLGDRISSLQADPSAAPEGLDADDLAALSPADFGSDAADPPGLGIPALALPVGLLLAVLVLMALATLIGHRAAAIVGGIVSVLAGIGGLLTGILLALAAFAALLLMVTLLLATPFGTLAYLAVYGFFDVGTSRIVLGLVLFLLLAAAVLLVIAQQRMLSNKRLMAFLALTLVLVLGTLLLHTLPPGILVSIADAIAALVVGIVGALWALAVLIGGAIALLKQLQPGRALSTTVREGERADLEAS